jgi:drug/metabolite transporter (DMT)-like permease
LSHWEAWFSHASPSTLRPLGIALVSGGIISLAFQCKGRRADFLPAAFTTGVLIGAYTVVDGIGVRLSGSSLAYTNSMFLLLSVTMPFIYWAMRERPPAYTKIQTVMALGGGIASIVAYGIVIWAMQYVAMGVVSALRETSVVWAMIILRIFLKEKLTARRIVSCLAIATGAACLAL